MSEPNEGPVSDRLTPAELRTLFLFEKLDDEQLALLVERGRVERRAAGTAVYTEGEPATCFFVLLSGTVAMSRQVRGDPVEVSRTEQRGVYGGATQAYIRDEGEQIYRNSLRAITDAEFFVLPADVFATCVREWFPMAMHLLEGLFFGMRASQTIVGERERLVALGSLSAGLTHELNNPAAAAVRATAVLRERVAGMRHKLAMIADGRLDGTRLHDLVELQEAAVKQAALAPPRSALETSDAEDDLADWLDDHGITGGWDLAATLVAGGIEPQWLEQITGAVGEENLDSAVRWLAYTVDTELLMGEIDDAVTRISGLVAAAKQYSQLDRAPYQTVDVHDLLHATLTMMQAKIPEGVRKVKEFDRTLPPIPAYAAELNQVFTNLIDNALGAMGGSGTLTLRTGRDDDCVFVEVGDTGPGIPPEIRPRIFEPFFTTKPVGEGTGLGLDISYRIIVNKHHGDIRVESSPGDTRFRVLLPVDPDRQERVPEFEAPSRAGDQATTGSAA
jgi:signal transduction histidine kinase